MDGGLVMRVLMLGWEFPPYISGGLGTACHGLTRAMNRLQIDITFVLPKADRLPRPLSETGLAATSVRSRSSKQEPHFENLTFKAIPSCVRNPYRLSGLTRPHRVTRRSPAIEQIHSSVSSGTWAPMRVIGSGAEGGYEGDMIGKVHTYARRCARLARDESFDVVHAHDWVTFPAAMAVAGFSGKPLIVHIHATEFDRSGEHVNWPVYEIERCGMHAAARVVAVSSLTKRTIIDRYGVPPEKVVVIHNGIEVEGEAHLPPRAAGGEKIVLFLGRITMQKGPEFFVRAAARVLERFDNVKFVIAGWGDLGPRMIEQVAAMGLGHKIKFTGFLRGRDVERAYRMADVYVMPSVSEPFGLTALEAIRYGAPVVISKNSGVAEVLRDGALKVDFWDVDQMANKIVTVLKYPAMAQTMRRCGRIEIRTLTWEKTARKCVEVYREGIESFSHRPGR